MYNREKSKMTTLRHTSHRNDGKQSSAQSQERVPYLIVNVGTKFSNNSGEGSNRLWRWRLCPCSLCALQLILVLNLGGHIVNAFSFSHPSALCFLELAFFFGSITWSWTPPLLLTPPTHALMTHSRQ
jgi:hypothetical protein